MKQNKIDYKKYCEVIHPMEYDGSGYSYVLARGSYLGMKFLVINCRGQHPCGYVDAKDTKFEKKYYDKVPISCHGGLTYSDKESPLTGEIGWWLGWDYGHYDDRVEYGNQEFNSFHTLGGGKKKSWTTAAVVKECLNVIKQIKMSDKKTVQG